MKNWFAKIFSFSGPAHAYDGPLREGQVWNYRARKQERASFLTIFMTTQDPQHGTIYHIRVEKLAIKKGSSELSFFPHAAITEKALRRSVTELRGENQQVPQASVKAYLAWNAAAHSPQALPVFSISVAEIAEQIEQALNSQP